MFVQETRVLSGWSLTVGVWPAEPLTVQRADPYAAAFPDAWHRRRRPRAAAPAPVVPATST